MNTNTQSQQHAIRNGVITHTEISSNDPAATKRFVESVLGWKFEAPTQTPEGPYNTWRFGDGTGGGIRGTSPTHRPGAVPYCEVSDLSSAYKSALKNGAREVLAPQRVPGSGGSIAVVEIPGGVHLGLWGPQ
jgi:predicted enzyme related to lactoylglutathione lyase